MIANENVDGAAEPPSPEGETTRSRPTALQIQLAVTIACSMRVGKGVKSRFWSVYAGR